MQNNPLLALVVAFVDKKFSEISLERGPRGPRGQQGIKGEKGNDGHDFSMQEHEEILRLWIKQASLKFSDLTPEQLQELKGREGKDGRDGRDGKDFDFSDYEDKLKSWISDSSLKFSDLTEEDKAQLRGERGHEGKRGVDGKDFSFEENSENISAIIFEHLRDLTPKIKLNFSDLTVEDREELRGRPGKDGRDGKGFIFEEHLAFFESLKLKFTDLSVDEVNALKLKFSDLLPEEIENLKLRFSHLSPEDVASLKGARGARGQRGRDGKDGVDGKHGIGLPGVQGLRGAPGDPGRDGVDGQDGREIVSIDTVERKDSFYFVFKFNDGTSLETSPIDIPKSSISETYIIGGGGSGGGGTPGADGKSAYEIAVENGFVGTEEEWLESLQGSPGDDGAPGLSAYEVALENGFVGTEEEWLESLKVPVEFFEEGVSVGSASKVNFTGDSVTVTIAGDTVEVAVEASQILDVLADFPCDSSVYVGAAVIVEEDNFVESLMEDWTFLSMVLSMDYGTYDALAVNGLADSMENSNVLGLVESKPTPTTCNIRLFGASAANYLGLQMNDEYYLSDEYPGALVKSDNIPIASGHVVLKIGQPINSTQLLFARGERHLID